MLYTLMLFNRHQEVVDSRTYRSLKEKLAIIQLWKYRYGKKFLELNVEDEKEQNTKTK